MQRIGGLRRKTRHLYQVSKRKKGKVSITKYMQEFKAGDKVKVLFDSSVHISPIKPRHYGKLGLIKKKRGSCYELDIQDHKNKKTIIVHPVHLEGV